MKNPNQIIDDYFRERLKNIGCIHTIVYTKFNLADIRGARLGVSRDYHNILDFFDPEVQSLERMYIGIRADESPSAISNVATFYYEDKPDTDVFVHSDFHDGDIFAVSERELRGILREITGSSEFKTTIKLALETAERMNKMRVK